MAGEIENPPIYDDFDYRAYLARQGIYSRMMNAKTTLIASGEGSAFYRWLYAFRDTCFGVLNRLLPEPAAALANGMILGIESGIPRDVADAFQATGTTHVIVISGSNIALLAGVLLLVLGRLIGRTRAVIPVIVAIGFYVLLVGRRPFRRARRGDGRARGGRDRAGTAEHGVGFARRIGGVDDDH